MPKTQNTTSMKKRDNVSLEEFKKIYKIAKTAIDDEKFSEEESISLLCKQYNRYNDTFNINFKVIKAMINGQVHHRTIGCRNTEYAFERIKEDFGMTTLKNAVLATKRHFERYHSQSQKGGRLRSLEKICDNWIKMYNFESPDKVKSHPGDIELQVGGHLEGAKILVPLHAYYERNRKNRDICLKIKGYKCVVCDFDFMEIYGEMGEGFIHVHHVNPLAEIDEEHLVDPEKDLCPICPNCHAMLHRGELITIEELQAIMKMQKTPVE